MYNKLLAISFVALFSAAACGGGKKVEKKTTEPAAEVDAAAEGDSKLQALCKKLCTGVAEKCADSDTKPKVEECVFACADATDGVLDDVKQCLDKADACDGALKCRAKFDGSKDED